MKNAPQSPSELRDALAAIFPTLPRQFGCSGESSFHYAGPTYDSVMREFAYFYTRDASEFSDRQLRRFAELVARCLARPGELAEAVTECFLDQARHPQVQARLEPFLAAAEKKIGSVPG